MPRKPRELEDGGIYHIFNRGNNRWKLFRDSEDYGVFYGLWYEAKDRCGAEVFHYCWMSNHYHVLLKIEIGKTLGRLLHWVQLGYARYFKKKYKTVGHIFQERYRSPRIPEESYYLQCGRYIERNPVKAKMVSIAERYPYSSAAYYAAGKTDGLITANLYYKSLGNTLETRRENYRKFLTLEDPYDSMISAALVKI